ncbi:MAG: outer membrane lipoprotein chaperone LolA [Chlorobi bacterium]|nr:outer membrane lipoprotein chaperone LolA [Chlorobiota bacterium]MCI0716316.1 outer membrane lipoprotein chaperone LolA [Chlorobiota bacterium]
MNKFLSAIIMGLFSASAIFAQDDITAQEIIQNVQNAYKDISDAKASFTQTIKFNKSKAQTSSGTLYIKKENKYRIETASQTIVTDGSTSWSYTPGKKQVIIDNYKETGNTFSPNKYLFQYPENFYSDLAGTEKMGGFDVYVLTLKPRESGYVKSAKLWVGKDDWMIKKIHIITEESSLTYSVKNIQTNTGISNSKFTFTPPEGTEVIDMR